jgi:hypothetical protein
MSPLTEQLNKALLKPVLVLKLSWDNEGKALWWQNTTNNILWIAQLSTIGVKEMVTFLFRSAPSRRKWNGHSHTQQWKRDGQRPTGRNVQSTIPIIASTKMTPKESKKAKRSIALAKRSHLEAIRIDWQREVDRSSIAELQTSRAPIAELGQNRRAAVANCSRTV